MFLIFKGQPGPTTPGKEFAINTDHITSISPKDENTTFITINGDSTPRYIVDAPFYDVYHKIKGIE